MDIEQQIQSLLSEIEQKHKISIILAIESGSRAWGFPSKDSDYDIRFIYHHEQERYLSVFEQRDVIDTVFIGDLDAGGWDIKKCLQLMNKGNAPLLEWLGSPIIYRQNKSKADLLRKLGTDSFNPKPIFYHYLSLAKKKVLDERTKTNTKSYLYALRALLCAKWIQEFETIPPVEFELLRQRYLDEGLLKKELLELLRAKKDMTEKDQYTIPASLIEYAENTLEALSTVELVVKKTVSREEYDSVFKAVLKS